MPATLVGQGDVAAVPSLKDIVAVANERLRNKWSVASLELVTDRLIDLYVQPKTSSDCRPTAEHSIQEHASHTCTNKSLH